MANIYDCAIVGGGVAGLALSILLAKSNKNVILFEKEVFPFHKVCGEYISNESISFLSSLGIDFKNQHLPQISQLLVSSPSGISIKRLLDIGGTGLSRYELDNQLFEIAKAAGVEIRTKTKVQNLNLQENIFNIQTANDLFFSKTAVGAYGKNTNIDVQLGRKYNAQQDSKLFIAVKHHIRADFDRTTVEMHNFSGGYCGLSAIEDGKINMSYISKIKNLKSQGSIAKMEKNILSRNPYLKKYFDHAEFIFEKPLTIAHLYFEIKEPVMQHILMLGDAAGNIAPLSGNGMSMALLSSKLSYKAIMSYLDDEMTFEAMEYQYTTSYYAAFSGRISVAKRINQLFVDPYLVDLSFRVLKVFPGIIDFMGKKIHGSSF